jgi:DNA mismatch repair protein MSH2
VSNLHFTADTRGEKLTLLYRVQPGPSDRSFGVHVAQIAKFPREIVDQAQAKVDVLEAEGHSVLQQEEGQEEEPGGAPEESTPRKRPRIDVEGERERKAASLQALAAKREALRSFASLALDEMPLEQALDAAAELFEGWQT